MKRYLYPVGVFAAFLFLGYAVLGDVLFQECSLAVMLAFALATVCYFIKKGIVAFLIICAGGLLSLLFFREYIWMCFPVTLLFLLAHNAESLEIHKQTGKVIFWHCIFFLYADMIWFFSYIIYCVATREIQHAHFWYCNLFLMLVCIASVLLFVCLLKNRKRLKPSYFMRAKHFYFGAALVSGLTCLYAVLYMPDLNSMYLVSQWFALAGFLIYKKELLFVLSTEKLKQRFVKIFLNGS